MENLSDEDKPTPESDAVTDPKQVPLFGRQQWIPYVLPFLVFMLAGQLEPRPPADPPAPEISDKTAEVTAEEQDTVVEAGFIEYEWYPLIYALRIGLTLAAVGVAWPMYRTFPCRLSALSIVAGVVGVVVWVGLCSLALEERLIPESIAGYLGIAGGRAAYNPLAELQGQPLALVGFLAVRFLGLALVVPLIEEFFLRGFVVRYVENGQWWKLPIGSSAGIAWAAVIIYAAATHPGELLAAVIWFSLVTALVVYTKNIWDAVAAHAVTNLLLGIYVVSTGHWELW